MSPQLDDATEVFRQAVTATMRAISGNDELSVTFGRGKPFIHGNKARIPVPELGGSKTALAGPERHSRIGLHCALDIMMRHFTTRHGPRPGSHKTFLMRSKSLESQRLARISCAGCRIISTIN